MSTSDRATGRNPRLDDSRDTAILAAAAALLGEVGYDAMSMEAIAARAGVGKATIYRRWPDKLPLVLDTLRNQGISVTELVDTGSLEGDLRALFFGALALVGEKQKVDHLLGVLVAMRSHPELASAAREQLVSVWTRAIKEIVQRAVARREIAPMDNESIERFSNVGPAVIFHRLLMGDEPIDATFMTQLVDDVLLPILQRHGERAAGGRRRGEGGEPGAWPPIVAV